MLIVVKVVGGDSGFVPPPGANKPGPGHRFFFSDNLELAEIDGIVPPGAAKPKAGTQSGIVTTVRIPDRTDPFVPGGDILLQYEGTFWLNAVAGTGLLEGQITGQGVILKKEQEIAGETKLVNVGIPTLAITGGTKAYKNARGQITEEDALRKIDIVL